MKRILIVLLLCTVSVLAGGQGKVPPLGSPSNAIPTSGPAKLGEKYVVNCNRIWHVWIDGPLMQTTECFRTSAIKTEAVDCYKDRDYETRTVMMKLERCSICGVLRVKP